MEKPLYPERCKGLPEQCRNSKKLTGMFECRMFGTEFSKNCKYARDFGGKEFVPLCDILTAVKEGPNGQRIQPSA